MKYIKAFLVAFFFIFFTNNVSALTHTSKFIDIDECYTNRSENLEVRNICFSKYQSTSSMYGTIFLGIENKTDDALDVEIIIDYYDKDYQRIARSVRVESIKASVTSHSTSVRLYEDDFLQNTKFEDIKYFKVSYKGSIPVEKEPEEVITYSKPSEDPAYKYYSYVLDAYDVKITVNEDNTLDIVETITAYFNQYKHGIFRTLPFKNTVIRADGTETNNRAGISNIYVSDKYTKSKENGNLMLKIGSQSITLKGEKKYTIKYRYNLGKDPLKDIDELYYNIIGSEWDTVIGNVTFTITMPKEFDASKLGFSSGEVGSTNNNVEYKVTGNKIEGKHIGVLKSGNALTVRCELPEGYFVGAKQDVDYATLLMFIVPLFAFIIALLIWKKYGKDDQVIETVEFYPPNGYNSLEVAYLYKGTVENKDITSLLIYLANKGYIKITETDEQSLFTKSKGFEITKLKEYDGTNINERIFLDGLFKRKNTVTVTDLYNRFYMTMNSIRSNINRKENRNKIFESSTGKKIGSLILLFLASLITIIAVPTLAFGELGEVITTIVICLFYTPFYLIGIFAGMPKAMRIFWLGFTGFHSMIFFATTPLVMALFNDLVYLGAFLFGLACIVGIAICIIHMPKRTPFGNEMLGKIGGFKDYLETAEKEKLESMVAKNPQYFYDILPFTYVLGISDLWIRKFEAIALQAPDWYSSSSGFNVDRFGTFMNSTMRSTQTAMSSSPSSSSSGGGSSRSSGGGRSGGGSGGGGGGSW